jgi:hypothetical protein
MNHRHVSSFVLVLATPLAFAALAQAATADPQPSSQSVSVIARPAAQAVRLDVRVACPGIDKVLQESLSPAWGRLQENGSMRVRFRMEGDRLTEVSSAGPLSDYRPYLRQAVSRLGCGVASGDVQDFAFELVIHGPDEESAQGALALLRE